MALADHVEWRIDVQTCGGTVPERLMAALPLGAPGEAGEGLYCGLVFSFPTAGKPTIEWWERSDDLERQGFVPIGAARARAICDALPRFLERLEQATQAPGSGPQAPADEHGPSHSGDVATDR